MKATILTVGDELLIGQVVNTNASWLGEHLDALGVDVTQMITLGDEIEAISETLARVLKFSNLVLISGGLGPTHDDLTREAVASYFRVDLKRDDAVLAGLRERFVQRGRILTERNRKLALVPEGFEVLHNPVGTAPGLWRALKMNRSERIVVLLPGVPQELRVLFKQEVAPRLQQSAGLRAIVHRTLHTAGIAESDLQEEVGNVSSFLGNGLRLAYLPGTGGVRLRLSARGKNREALNQRLDAFEAVLQNRIGPHIYGRDGDRLEAVVGHLLEKHSLSIAVAESCTGGRVADQITNVSGSAAYMQGGIVAYSNQAKLDLLSVSPNVLAEHGAVSEIVARQMAIGVRKRLTAHIGISTTGIAGPTGGTPEKPVGTVWIGYADAEHNFARQLRLTQDRDLNKALSTTAVLDLVRRQLAG